MLESKLKASDFEKESGQKIANIMDKYFSFEQETLNGYHGKTAQFHLTYINMIQHQFNLFRSIRTGNFDLYKYVLPQFSNLFFMFNQVNYARWLVYHHNNLINIKKTHPPIYTAFQAGMFGVKKTTTPLSGIPNDLTLEQTYNADAGRKLTGISHFTNNAGAKEDGRETTAFGQL